MKDKIVKRIKELVGELENLSEQKLQLEKQHKRIVQLLNHRMAAIDELKKLLEEDEEVKKEAKAK